MGKLDKTKEKLLNLALNKIQGEWDYSKLYDVLVVLEGDDIAITGFDTDEIKKIKDLLASANDDIDLSSDFDDRIKQNEWRIFIAPESPILENVRAAIQKIKEDFSEVVIREIT